jgi:hypothetical protein
MPRRRSSHRSAARFGRACSGGKFEEVLKPGMVIMAEPNPITVDGLFGIFLGHTASIHGARHDLMFERGLDHRPRFTAVSMAMAGLTGAGRDGCARCYCCLIDGQTGEPFSGMGPGGGTGDPRQAVRRGGEDGFHRGRCAWRHDPGGPVWAPAHARALRLPNYLGRRRHGAPKTANNDCQPLAGLQPKRGRYYMARFGFAELCRLAR